MIEVDKIKEEFDIMDYTFRDKSILFHETNEVSLFPKVSALENRVIELYPIENPKCIRIYKKDAKALSRFFGLNKSRDKEIKKLRECLGTLLSECANDLSGQACLFIEKALKDIT